MKCYPKTGKRVENSGLSTGFQQIINMVMWKNDGAMFRGSIDKNGAAWYNIKAPGRRDKKTAHAGRPGVMSA